MLRGAAVAACGVLGGAADAHSTHAQLAKWLYRTTISADIIMTTTPRTICPSMC